MAEVKRLEEALDKVELTYKQIVEIATDMTSEIFDPINRLVDDVQNSINTLSIEDIRNYIMRLATRAFQLVEMKEKAVLRAECAEAIRKESYATMYAGYEGNATARDNQATLAIAENIVAQCLYNLISNLFKSKVDHLNRLVDALKSILISKQQEVKMENNALI